MTGRPDPRLDWAIDSLAHQVRADDEVCLIVVDALASHDPKRTLRDLDFIGHPAISDVIYTAPKPNVWQGAQRITRQDWWATSNARNTALALVPSHVDYVAFLDDRCRVGDHWLDAIRKGYTRRQSVLAGTYTKEEGGGGQPLRKSVDHRIGVHPGGKVNCGGGWLYGCTFALPLQWALDVNGFEEGCDGLTGEDYIFGLMLGNRGHRIDFDIELAVAQDRTRGNESCKGSYRCSDKGISPNDKSHAALARFGKRTRTEFTPNLVELRRHLQSGGSFPDVDQATDHRDWFDGQLIRDMV